MWCEAVRRRERGELRPRRFETVARARRTASLALSNRKEFASPHNGAVNSLQIDTLFYGFPKYIATTYPMRSEDWKVDLTERRYLLSGASDGSAAIFDVQNATEYEAGFIAKHKNIMLVDKQHENGHKFAVSMAIWYPVDTGLFVTASFDQYVKVWDTNSTQVVMDFKMPGKVYSAAMSPIATTHMLIATGSADVQLRSQLGRRPPFLESTSEKDLMNSLQPSASTKIYSAQQRTGKSKKQSHTLHKSQIPGHGHIQQRLHPGLSSSQNRATAHYGAVTGLRTTTDGMYLLSSGSDSRLRLWDIDSGCNTLVNFETTRLQTSKPLQLAVAEDPSLVFIPCMASIKAYNLWSGMTFQTFRGHYEPVNCCYYSAQEQEDDDKRLRGFVIDEDNWSE
uniref:Anaphase-promoting complex subunit 4 WD40 domain-containing protein n=1 Tax=Leersia perrieri TaxID=77586 RepID=A0A0D9V802_9ORYZ